MMTTSEQIIQMTNVHKRRSDDYLYDNQVAYIPTVEDDQVEYIAFSYMNGTELNKVAQSTQVCLRVRYLKFKPMNPRLAAEYCSGMWTLQELVDKEVLYPFLLFLNGRFIPWEMISVSINQNLYYILVDIGEKYNYSTLIRGVLFAQIMTLPNHVRYITDDHEIDDKTVFSFDEDGAYNAEATDYLVKIYKENKRLVYKFWHTTEGVNAVQVLNNTRIKITEANVIVFKQGLLATGTRERIYKGFDTEKTDLDGSISEYITYAQPSGTIDTNPTVKVDSVLVTINNGFLEDGYRLDFGVFVNSEGTITDDNIYRTDPVGLQSFEQNYTEYSSEDWYTYLHQPFVLSMDKDIAYDENLSNAIKTIFEYNSTLFNEVFKRNTNLVIEEHDGQWVYDTMIDGALNLSRMHCYMLDEYIMVFVNGVLYKYYDSIKYKYNRCIVPIAGIEPDDSVIIFRFQNINNDTYTITIEDDGYHNYSPEIFNDHMILFSTEQFDDYYTFPDDGLQHFPVNYTILTDERGWMRIVLRNSKYYGLPLTLAYDDRWVRGTYTLTATEDPEEFSIDLGDTFMYCNDYSRYMVFYNGYRLSTEQYRLTLPVRTDTNYSKFEIHVTAPIYTGDKLDIFYVPTYMKDIIFFNSIEDTGNIEVDKSLLVMPLCTDLNLLWVNGKLVPSSQIANIDTTHIKIIADQHSLQNVCVTQYIPSISTITDAFLQNSAIWDTITAALEPEDLYKLLGITPATLTDTDAINYDGIEVSTIMKEIVRNYYAVEGVGNDTGDGFAYNYTDVDDTIITSTDDETNTAALLSGDAEDTQNLEEVYRYEDLSGDDTTTDDSSSSSEEDTTTDDGSGT